MSHLAFLAATSSCDMVKILFFTHTFSMQIQQSLLTAQQTTHDSFCHHGSQHGRLYKPKQQKSRETLCLKKTEESVKTVFLCDGRDRKRFLTSTDLGNHSMCQGSALCQLFSKALTHVVINIIGSQQLFKGLKVVENFSKFNISSFVNM